MNAHTVGFVFAQFVIVLKMLPVSTIGLEVIRVNAQRWIIIIKNGFEGGQD